ncbi:MAG: methyl-accepting transducer, partial [Clostridium sp.]|nr:methyl-accepting transducer [Clostridium sp.]
MERTEFTIVNLQRKFLKFVLFAYAIGFSVADIALLFSKSIGGYRELEWKYILIFAGMVVTEIIVSKIMYNDTLKEGKWKKSFSRIKIASVLICYINYLYLSFIIPSGEFWISICFLIILFTLFFDSKTAIYSTVMSILCEIILFSFSSLLISEAQMTMQGFVVRSIFIVFINIIVLVVALTMGNMAKQMENNEKTIKEKDNGISQLLNKISKFAETVLSSSTALTSSIEDKSSAMQEIA